jgi:hypothetical protein
MARLGTVGLMVALLSVPAAGLGQDRASLQATRPPVSTQALERAPAVAALRAPPFTLVNELPSAVTSLRLKADDSDADFGPNLLDSAVGTGERRALRGIRGSCAHRFELGFANGRRLQRSQNICEQPELLLALQSAARPPLSEMATVTRPDIAAAVRPPIVAGSGVVVREQITRPIEMPPPPATTTSTATGSADAAAPAVDTPASTSAAPAPQAGPDGRVYCAIVEERLPAEECAALSAVERGTAAYKTPERMKRGDSESIFLSISREAGSSAPEEALADAEGVQGQFKPVVGRYIEARLFAEPGLKVTPDPGIPELQDLGASPAALWRWTITAETTGVHELTLRTRVMTRRPDGSFVPRGAPWVGTRKINVYVEGAEAASDWLAAIIKPIQDATGATDSLAKLIVALTALVVAVGGLWIAIRRFGKGGAKPPESD